MKSRLIYTGVLLLVIINPLRLYSQSHEISITMGIGTFHMGVLKDFQEIATKDYPVKLESAEQFPPFLTYSLRYEKRKDRNSIGAIISIQSTGVRSAYTDYSGHIYFDQLAEAIQIGPYYNWHFSVTEDGYLYLGINLNFVFTGFKMYEEIAIEENNNTSELYAYSIGGDIYPMLGYKLLKNRFSFGAEVGINLNYHNSILKELNSNEKLYFGLNNSTKTLKANWTGIRGTIIISYTIKTK